MWNLLNIFLHIYVKFSLSSVFGFVGENARVSPYSYSYQLLIWHYQRPRTSYLECTSHVCVSSSPDDKNYNFPLGGTETGQHMLHVLGNSWKPIRAPRIYYACAAWSAAITDPIRSARGGSGVIKRRARGRFRCGNALKEGGVVWWPRIRPIFL
jgi:hypothetical protein